MPRSFVVIGESAAVMTNCDNRLIEVEEVEWKSFRSCAVPFILAKNRIKRVLCKHVLDVGDQQFLMLLLMMKTENEYRFDLAEQLFVGPGKPIVHMRIDRRAVALRLSYGRA